MRHIRQGILPHSFCSLEDLINSKYYSTILKDDIPRNIEVLYKHLCPLDSLKGFMNLEKLINVETIMPIEAQHDSRKYILREEATKRLLPGKGKVRKI